MRDRRSTCDPALGSAVAARLLDSGLLPHRAVIGGFWPLTGEIDIRPALFAATERGHVVGLPITPRRGEGLSFRRWLPGSVLRPGRFGTLEPDGELVSPDLFLVPLLAFDRAGGRLGYGGGFYDRTFAAMTTRFQAIGCGFAVQEVDTVPTETHDWRLNAIVTETDLIVVE